MKTAILTVAAAALVLQACASSGPRSGYEGLPSDSRAYRIAQAAGIEDVRDVELPGSENLSMAGPNLFNSASAGGVVGALAPAAGLTSISSGALGLLSGMATQRATPSRLIAWVPTTLAPTPHEAADLVVQYIREADIPGIWNQTVVDAEMLPPIPSSDGEDLRYPIKHPDCMTETSCQYWLSQLRYKYEPNVLPPKSEPQADSSFIVMNFPGNSYYSNTLGNPPVPKFPDIDVISEISRRLPEWIYLYIPPKGAGIRDKDGNISFISFPFIMNKGDILLFVKNK
jgi:outer membrane lipoprotein SlyB